MTRLLLLLALFPITVHAQESGGRDVSIALFSTQRLAEVTATPLGASAWTAACARCTHQPLTEPLHITRANDIFAGGPIRVTDDATGATRSAAGLWHIRAGSVGQSTDVVLTMPSEHYVAAVLNAEAAPNEPAQSLQALAIVVRTYALNGGHYTAPAGHLPAELCDSTQCQAMLLQPASSAIDIAVRTTAGETLWFGTHRAETYFSQSCGGVTETAGAVWPRLSGVTYLQSHPDPYCLRRERAAWHAEIPLTKLATIATSEGWHLPAQTVSARVLRRTVSRRALSIQFTGRNGETAVLSASALRFGIGRSLGWNQVRSDAYELGIHNGALVFDGRGHGHGVGLCQTGAAEMAVEGRSERDILAFYFPGTDVRIMPGDHGWQQISAGPLILRTTRPLSTARRIALQRVWSQALLRFPPRQSLTPTLVFAPSTEMFRQLTSQPGWALASTQGKTIVLQPEAVLRAPGRDEDQTLLHEMLHVAVESECNRSTPLWLREGLVEALAGDGSSSVQAMSIDAIDTALQHSDSLVATEQAHRAAAAKVRALISRYGLATVRGWLSSGPPKGIV